MCFLLWSISRVFPSRRDSIDFATDLDVLRAALEFVDTFVAEKPPKMRPAPRLRWELKTLREETEMLEHQLHLHRVLVQKHQVSAAQQVARCQRERRRRAEVDNAQLRSSLRESSLLTRRIVKALKTANKNRDQALRHLYPAFSGIPRSLRPVEWSNLSLEAVRMCDQATAIFAHAHFAPAPGQDPCAKRLVLTKKPTRHGLHIELVDSRVTPFDFRATGEAIWHHVAHHNICGDVVANRCQNERVTEDQAELEFLFRWIQPQSSTVFPTKVGARRLVTPSSVMIVSAVEIQAEVDRLRVAAAEKVWTLVQPLEIHQTARSMALVQTYVMSTPSSRVGKSLVVEDSFGSIETHMEKQWGHIESLLLDPVGMSRWRHATLPSGAAEE